MLSNIKKAKSDQKGFTIIEVLIVLAIAGLILLIVFLAVPALQRTQRNTSRKNDVAAILGAVSEYSNNHSGSLPATAGFQTAFTDAEPKLGYYDIASATAVAWKKVGTATTVAASTDLDKVVIANYAKCGVDGNGKQAGVARGGTARSIVAVYSVEGSGGAKVSQCQESGS